MTDPIHPIGPRGRDIEPVQRLHRLARDARRDQPDPEGEESQEHPAKRHAEPHAELPAPPEIDDGNPHIDVRV